MYKVESVTMMELALDKNLYIWTLLLKNQQKNYASQGTNNQ